jgi:hypothetical protein
MPCIQDKASLAGHAQGTSMTTPSRVGPVDRWLLGCTHMALQGRAYSSDPLPVLPAMHAACRESLLEVQHYVDCLADIENGNTKHATPQTAPVPSKTCLLAIGAHIEGRRLPYWLNGFVDTSTLWHFVATATRHRMRGEQLATLYKGIRQQSDSSGGKRRVCRGCNVWLAHHVHHCSCRSSWHAHHCNSNRTTRSF